MKKLLAIETSSEACSVALSVDGDLRELHEHAPLRHAELVLPAVSRLLAEAGLAVADLDAIAFGRGPGSFTSLRIGIGVVQGLAWAADLPVVPCSSLAAVAQEAADRTDMAGVRITVAVDARMQEVFCAAFERAPGDDLVRLVGEERVCAPGAVGVDPAADWIAAGNGFARYPELQPLRQAALACYEDLWPRASLIARLALGWLADNAPLPAAHAQPVYIRDNVADKPSL
jgi:tRNA threonylcarbamoyladenosine biosynthesis protein TsaB